MPVTYEEIAREIEPDAWEEWDDAPVISTNDETGEETRSVTKQSQWAITSSLEAAKRIGDMLTRRGIKNETTEDRM